MNDATSIKLFEKAKKKNVFCGCKKTDLLKEA